MNLLSLPDGRIINLEHLAYAERAGEYLALHFDSGAEGGAQAKTRRRRKAGMGVPCRQMHREDRGGLVPSDHCLTIVVAARVQQIYMTYSFLRNFFGQGFCAGIAVDVLQFFPPNCLYENPK